MSRRSDLRRLDERGFTLLAVLMAVGFFSLMLVALLGLVDVDSTTSTAFSLTAKTRRAADGGLNVAVTRIKTNTSADIFSDGQCGGVDGSTTTLEGKQVTITCDVLPSTEPEVASPGAGGTVLTLLGNYDGYSGQVASQAKNTTQLDINNVIIDAANLLSSALANGPGLIHVGGEPLRIVGSAKVRQSALVVKSPAPSPAVKVTGDYAQGDLGPLGGIDVRFFDLSLFSTPKCGMLDPTFPGGDTGTYLAVTGTRTCAPSGGRDAVAPAAGPDVSAPANWTTAQLRAGTGLPLTCASSNGVVRLAPGAYNLKDTAVLNNWFRGQGCGNVTFWFAPGDYYFDASGLSAGNTDNRDALVFDNPNSRWVFGTPKGWDPDAGGAPADVFPQACDRTRPGASVTLTSRTVVKHYRGLVALCGKLDGSGRPLSAIYQEAASPVQTWAAVPGTAAGSVTGLTGAGLPAMSNPMNAAASVAPAPADFPGWGGDFNTSEAAPAKVSSGTCPGSTGLCTFGLVFNPAQDNKSFVDPGEPAPGGSLTRAVLKLRGTTSNVPAYSWPAALWTTSVRITWGDGSNGACTIQNLVDVPRSLTAPYTPTNQNASAGPGIDLLGPCNQNGYSLTDASQLENAKIEVFENVGPQGCFLCTPPSYGVSIDYAWIETTTTPKPPSLMSTVVDPPNGRAFNVYGPVYAPRSQIDVQWAGAANATPIFVGPVVARALGSHDDDFTHHHVGVFAANTLAPPIRRLQLTARIDGRPIARARVQVTDVDTSLLVHDPGRLLEVTDWSYCGNAGSGGVSC